MASVNLSFDLLGKHFDKALSCFCGCASSVLTPIRISDVVKHRIKRSGIKTISGGKVRVGLACGKRVKHSFQFDVSPGFA